MGDTQLEQAKSVQGEETPEFTVAELRRFRFVTVYSDRSWGIACTSDPQLIAELCPSGPSQSGPRDSVTGTREYEKRFGRATVENAWVVMCERGYDAQRKMHGQPGFAAKVLEVEVKEAA